MIVIGTDEAGYGPNYGPLVITATVWKTNSEDCFSPFAGVLREFGITIDDSKKIYHGGETLSALETMVRMIFRHLCISEKNYFPASAGSKLDALNGFAELPLDTDREAVLAGFSTSLATTLNDHDMKIVSARSRTIFPGEFNHLLEQSGSKGTLLSDETLKLVLESLVETENESVLVLCDKHGGRNRYLDLLTEHFDGEFIQVLDESREKSCYRLRLEDSPIEMRFLAKGDSLLPVALSSMISKYGRELAMLRFNEFWQDKIPGLRPTAGYPEDAKRFRKEIAAVQKKLGIENESIWRNR